MTAQLSPPSVQKFFDNTGLPLAFGLLYTYAAGTTTLQATYVDSTQTTQNTNPITLNARGECALWLDPSKVYKFNLTDALGNQIPGWPVDNIQGGFLNPTGNVIPTVDNTFTLGSSTFSWANVYIGSNHAPVLDTASGNFGYNARTAAEITAGITPSNPVYQGLETIDVLRYGIVPNSAGAATANTTALTALVNPSNTGPTGRLVFPNTTGADIYYFNNMIQVRDGIRMDLMGSTLNFSKTYASSDDCFGFFTFIRDVTIENGSITVTYTGSGGNSPGPIMRIGGRSGGSAPTFNFDGITPANFYESLFSKPMGNITVRNLRLTTNNAAAPCVLMLGGLQNCLFENLYINGSTTSSDGMYYEYGYWSQNGAPGTPSSWSSAHARNMVFRNINVINVASATANGLGLTGCYNCIVDGLFVDTAFNGFAYRPGEALFYRVGTPDATGAKRTMTLRNIVGQNIASTGIQLTGAELALGYLATVISGLGHPGDYIAQTDLMTFSLDGFAVSAVTGINVSGTCDIRNGTLTGGGNIVITDECMHFTISNVQVLNSTGIGIRASFGNAIWSPARLKAGKVSNCKICGSAANPGSAWQNCRDVEITDNQFGFNTIWDSANESTQTQAVSVDATTNGGGVYCRRNYVTTNGTTAYNLTGSATQINATCSVDQPRGTVTVTGVWDIDEVMQSSAANIAAKISWVNNLNGTTGITNKYLGRMCYDLTNSRLMIAQGPAGTDTWVRADGGVTVTPS